MVIASGNAGKLRELQAMLQPLGWDIHAQSEWGIEEAEENGLSFIENALIKARHASSLCGMPALGDDSGLVVGALNGQPGIFSARYAGENANDADNNRKLLDEMRAVSDTERSAHFYCAMAFVRYPDDPAPLVTTGSWAGSILRKARGEGGFGYDPLFWLEGRQCASAELAAEERNGISHRGQALAAMVQALEHVRLG